MVEIPELKPCPFCGGTAQLAEGHRDHWLANCVSCGAVATSRWEAREGARHRAANHWNRRATRAARTEGVTEGQGTRHQTPAAQGFEGGAHADRNSATDEARRQAAEIAELRAALEKARETVIAECVEHIEYVRKNIIVPPHARKRFDLQDMNRAFRNALTIAKERITGEDKDLWIAPEDAALRDRAEEEAGR